MSTLIFDIGKTNKKLLVFDKGFNIIHQESTQFAETEDEDGFPCDNLGKLSDWVISRLRSITQLNSTTQLEKSSRAKPRLNFSAYGASWVHIDKNGKPLTPL